MDDDFVKCPLDESHVVTKHRLAHHLIKCAAHYTGPPMKACPFNTTHLIKLTDNIHEHYETCADYQANYLPEYEQQ